MRIIIFLIESVFDLLCYGIEEALSKKSRSIRRLKKTIISNTDAVEERKPLRLIGEVKSDEWMLTSPFKHEKCVGYSAVVNRDKQAGTETIITEVDGCDFFIEDKKGKVLIKFFQADLIIETFTHIDTGLLNKPSEDLIAFLERHEETPKSFGMRKSFSFLEGTLKAGDLVTVYGEGVWTTTENGDRMFVMAASEKKPLIISNLKKLIKQKK